MLKAGDQAPAFILEQLGGGKLALSEVLARGPALLVLVKISCPTCQLTLPYLDRLGPGNLQVIAISQDEESGTTRFRKTYGVHMTTLLDRERNDYAVSNAFRISYVPSMFLVEQDGRVSMTLEGFVKRDLEAVAKRAGVAIFGTDDHVPEWKAG